MSQVFSKRPRPPQTSFARRRTILSWAHASIARFSCRFAAWRLRISARMLSACMTRLVLIAVLTVLARPAAAQVTSADAAERGFQALQRGDADTAATMLRIALAARPRDPMLLFGAGVAAHLQGREQDASTALKQALQLEPRLTQASALLGEIAHSEGDLERAIDTYE